jgi:predicted DNA-binding ribbon-helix-helix protein
MIRKKTPAQRKTKTSIVIHRHKTSISVEPEFKEVLQEMAFATGVSFAQIVEQIEMQDRDPNLSRACRLAVLQYCRLSMAQKVQP